MPHTIAVATEPSGRLRLFIRTQSPVTVATVLILAVAAGFGLPAEAPPLIAGIALIAAATVASLALPWERLEVRWQAGPAVLDLAGIALVSVALYPALQTFAALAIVPAVWLAMVGGVPGLVIALIGSYAAAFAPVLVRGGGASEWASALSFAVIIPLAAVIGYVLARRYLRANEERDGAIAKRSAALDEVERLSQIVQAFAETVDAGVLILDERGEPLIANERLRVFADIGGYDAAAGAASLTFGADQATLVPEEDLPIRRFLNGQAVDAELVWAGQPGAQSALLVSGHQLMREDGSPLGSALIAQEVTEVVRAGREREDAMATLAHELRTPLTSIIGYVDLINAQGVPPEAEDSLRVIARNAEHLVTLSASFLNGMRDILDVKIEQLDLREMVEVSVEVLRGTRDGAAREWVVDLPTELSGAGDRDGVFEVLANVLGNAVKYSPPGGLIEVTAAVSHPYVEITIANEGTPIAPQDLARIFDRFYRGANARNAVAGTGIGLSVSRDIMKASGGAITVSNTPSGVAFVIGMPAA
ncbi:sensor histidine kinase [Microbacterium radiodurans]|uniref:Sensor-like histidine kinase SenX3 n=1 Tax=Microbacterium radiodurans TaxID=661398 RepID=A0A5J5IMC0_9MICO|nr:ATP-binding protein [Microbacterium radiodurans]KAA9083740.1 hypothetical protein F6B42_14405 [Microbacterium radiodurans]